MSAIRRFGVATVEVDVSTRRSEETYGAVSASKIIGTGVVNRQGESLGKIHELVIDAKKGLVYAVLSVGGFMGLGNKLFAMPWKALEFSNTENKLILDVDKKKLAGVSGRSGNDAFVMMMQSAELRS